MKKHALFSFCLFPLSLGLFGCGGTTSPSKVSLLFGSKEFTSLTAVSSTSHMKKLEDQSALETLIKFQESFLLIVLGDAHVTCGCWNAFHQNNIVRFQQETNTLFYYIYSNQLKDDFGMSIGSQKAALGIFSKGKLVYENSDSDESSEFYKDYQSFKEWMLARVTLPRVFHLTREQLSSMYEGWNEFTIYFSRQTCGDCAFIQTGAYREYFETHPTGIEDSYIIDLDSVGIGAIEVDGVIHHRSSAEDATPEQKEAQRLYEEFKVEYGLNQTEDNPAGYGQGYVPTFYHINPEGNGKKTGDVIDISGVFFNDKVAEDGTILDTYFTAERLELESLSYLRESNLQDKTLLGKKIDLEISKRDGLSFYHNPILNLFLDASIGSGK
ncbi:MAG: hypothetical protein SOV58_04505 [Candidatus Enteromonas sp.]|nr:hypothetical protein [Candidatus Enteromonas sp.]